MEQSASIVLLEGKLCEAGGGTKTGLVTSVATKIRITRQFSWRSEARWPLAEKKSVLSATAAGFWAK